MPLELTMLDPNSDTEEINAYVELSGIELDFDYGGELRFKVWKNADIRERVRRRESNARQLGGLFIIAVGEEEVVHRGVLVKLKLDDILDRNNNFKKQLAYVKMQEHTVKWGSRLLNLTNSRDV